MISDFCKHGPETLLATAAAAAACEVHESIMDHASHLGRSGILVRLRVQARELAQSAFGRDQVRSRAFEAAADDISWGRAPLTRWRTFAPETALALDDERAALRDRVPQPDAAIEAAGSQVARDIERSVLSSDDALNVIRRLATELADAAMIQAALWDDPRITATPDLRAHMRASIAPLQRRAGALARDQRPPVTSRRETPRPVRGWRKLFATRR